MKSAKDGARSDFSYLYWLCGNCRRIRRLASLPVEQQRHDNGHCARACRRRHALRGFERRRRCENAKTGQVIWSHTYTNPSEPQALIKAQSNAASEIATAIGQPYGVVTSDLRRSIPSVSSMQSYVCVLRAYAFRRNFSRENFASILQCLEKAVQRDAAYSDAWAMLG